ncbi:right-handed parallel beta-helix repeat-containing protein [bacterium]|nr:right-handed parallel beta-helix repeat-containing protein [bacterium]
MQKIKMFFGKRVAFLSTVLMFTLGMAAAQSPVVNITSGISYGTLSDAINALNDGETLEIRSSGTYPCPGLTIKKNNVTLRGANGVTAILNGDFNWNGCCLKIEGNGVNLSNLDIIRALDIVKAAGVNNLVLNNLRINNANGNGVLLDGITGISISTLAFYQVNGSAVNIKNSDSVSISDVTAANYGTINKCIEITGTTDITINRAFLGSWNRNMVLSQCTGVTITGLDMVYGNYGLSLDSCPGTVMDSIDSENIIYTNIAINTSNNCVIRNGTLQPQSREAIALSNASGTNILDMRMLCRGGATSGVTVTNSPSTVIRRCEIKNGGYDGVTVTASAGCTIENTLLCSNRKGILLTSSSNSTLIKNNTVINNLDSGISLGSVNGVNIRNNIVVNNGKTYWTWGIRCEWGTVQNLSLTYNDIWNNRENYSNCIPGTGSLSVDPLLVDGCADAHLRSGSPCIDTGDPDDPVGDEPSPNGGRINIGVYGGTVDATTTAQVEVTIAEAAARGWVNLYCYPWQDIQYVQISGLPGAANTILPPWCGFWVIVNQDVDIVFPHNPTAQIPSPGNVMSKELLNSWYYLISVPLNPVNKDVNAVFGDDLGDGLYDGSTGQKWRVSKWNVDSGDYTRYTGTGSFPELIPGRGVWIRQIYDETRTITVSGNPVSNTSDYSLKLKSTGGETYHMIGNPYPYNIDWRSVKVRVPMTDALQAGKIAAPVDFNDIRTWDVELKLSTTNGIFVDANNKAGVILSEDDYSYMLNAVDMEPFADDYIRLYLLDPDDQDRNKRSYDYRGPFENSCVWNVVLSTSMDEAQAILDLGNLSSIPDLYTATLTAPDLTVTALTGDVHIPVTLSSNADVVYRLTLTRAEPLAVEEESIPRAFGIVGASPNPFNPATTIEYITDHPGNVQLSVYNIAGQKIAVLAEGIMNAGKHSVTWYAAGQGSGVYFVILETSEKRDVRKVMLMR